MKSFRLLEAFNDNSIWLGTTELAVRASITKPTASRIAKSLSALGYLHYSPKRRKYRLGYAVLSLGYSARTQSGVSGLVREHLQNLADTFGVHSSLATRDQTDIVQIEVARSSNTLMTLRLDAGSRIPIAGTASGHAYLASMSESERTALLKQLRERHKKHWQMLKQIIASAIADVHTQGFTMSQRGWQTDINGVAVPLVIPGEKTYVLTCGAPARHLSQKTMMEIGHRLVHIAQLVVAKLTGKESKQ